MIWSTGIVFLAIFVSRKPESIEKYVIVIRNHRVQLADLPATMLSMSYNKGQGETEN